MGPNDKKAKVDNLEKSCVSLIEKWRNIKSEDSTKPDFDYLNFEGAEPVGIIDASAAQSGRAYCTSYPACMKEFLKGGKGTKDHPFDIENLYELPGVKSDHVLIPQSDEKGEWQNFHFKHVGTTKRPDGIGPLALAAYLCKPHMVKQLIKMRHDINCQSRDGATPLMEAIFSNTKRAKDRLETIRILLEKGASPNIQTKKNGDTALTIAAWRGDVEVVQLIGSNFAKLKWAHITKRGHNVLTIAVFKKHWPLIKYLLQERKIEIMITDKTGLTCMDICLLNKGYERYINALASYMALNKCLAAYMKRRVILLKRVYCSTNADTAPSATTATLLGVMYLSCFKEVRDVIVQEDVIGFLHQNKKSRAGYPLCPALSSWSIAVFTSFLLARCLIYGEVDKIPVLLNESNWTALNHHKTDQPELMAENLLYLLFLNEGPELLKKRLEASPKVQECYEKIGGARLQQMFGKKYSQRLDFLSIRYNKDKLGKLERTFIMPKTQISFDVYSVTLTKIKVTKDMKSHIADQNMRELIEEEERQKRREKEKKDAQELRTKQKAEKKAEKQRLALVAKATAAEAAVTGDAEKKEIEKEPANDGSGDCFQSVILPKTNVNFMNKKELRKYKRQQNKLHLQQLKEEKAETSQEKYSNEEAKKARIQKHQESAKLAKQAKQQSTVPKKQSVEKVKPSLTQQNKRASPSSSQTSVQRAKTRLDFKSPTKPAPKSTLTKMTDTKPSPVERKAPNTTLSKGTETKRTTVVEQKESNTTLSKGTESKRTTVVELKETNREDAMSRLMINPKPYFINIAESIVDNNDIWDENDDLVFNGDKQQNDDDYEEALFQLDGIDEIKPQNYEVKVEPYRQIKPESLFGKWTTARSLANALVSIDKQVVKSKPALQKPRTSHLNNIAKTYDSNEWRKQQKPKSKGKQRSNASNVKVLSSNLMSKQNDKSENQVEKLIPGLRFANGPSHQTSTEQPSPVKKEQPMNSYVKDIKDICPLMSKEINPHPSFFADPAIVDMKLKQTAVDMEAFSLETVKDDETNANSDGKSTESQKQYFPSNQPVPLLDILGDFLSPDKGKDKSEQDTEKPKSPKSEQTNVKKQESFKVAAPPGLSLVKCDPPKSAFGQAAKKCKSPGMDVTRAKMTNKPPPPPPPIADVPQWPALNGRNPTAVSPEFSASPMQQLSSTDSNQTSATAKKDSATASNDASATASNQLTAAEVVVADQGSPQQQISSHESPSRELRRKSAEESGYMSPPMIGSNNNSNDNNHGTDAMVTPPQYAQNWFPRSKRWHPQLTKVARCHPGLIDKAGSINFYLRDNSCIIALGSCGTTVTVGIRDDGTEVAVKRMVKCYSQLIKNELNNLRIPDLDHPNIIKYRDYVEDNHFAYLALELCEGTLEERVRCLSKKGTLGQHACELSRQLMTGLAALHDAKILHMDLKPRNVLIDVKGNVKLADFGLSHRLDDSSNTFYHATQNGTKCWRPPETICNRVVPGMMNRYKQCSDVYVAGMILYYIFTGGMHPFGTDANSCEMNIQRGALPITKGIKDQVFIDLLFCMLNPDMNKRISTQETLMHPYFWSSMKRFEFLVAVGQDRDIHKDESKTMLTHINNVMAGGGSPKNWGLVLDKDLVQFLGWVPGQNFTITDILTIVIPALDEADPQELSKVLRGDCAADYVLQTFPHLFMVVYEAVGRAKWTRKRSMRDYFFSKPTPNN